MIGYPHISETNAMEVVQQHINRSSLMKVQDETGKSIGDLGIFGVWANNIGNFIPGEGCKVKLNAKDTLT